MISAMNFQNNSFNPFNFMRQRQMMNPFQNMSQTLQYIRQMRQDPSQLSNFLLQQGCITQQQFNEIQQMGIGGNPEAIGNYMMNHGSFNQQQSNDAYNNIAMPIYKSMENSK